MAKGKSNAEASLSALLAGGKEVIYFDEKIAGVTLAFSGGSIWRRVQGRAAQDRWARVLPTGAASVTNARQTDGS